MSSQPEALELADALEDAGKPAFLAESAAAELRRLHAQRDALLEALKWYVETDEVDDAPGNEFWIEGRDRARAAIKAAEEKT